MTAAPDRPPAPLSAAAGPPRPQRWQALADGVAAVLGLNVWVTLILVPALFTGALRGPVQHLGALIPLAALGIGLARRSVPWLLGAFPAALLLPITFAPRLVAGHVHGPWSFLLVAASLVGYLFTVSWFSTFRDLPAPVRLRALPGNDDTPPRWARRFRIYRGLALLSLLLPAALLYAVNFDPEHLTQLRDRFPGRTAAMLTLGNLAMLGLWLALYAWVFIGVLGQHRSGDRALAQDLADVRKRPARPRLQFYVYVVLALATMGVLVVLRYR